MNPERDVWGFILPSKKAGCVLSGDRRVPVRMGELVGNQTGSDLVLAR